MKKILSIAILALLFSGCASSSPVTGMFYTGTTHSGVGSGGVVDNNVKTTKVGTSTCSSVLGLFAFGDCSVTTAKQNGNITKVNSVDHETTSMFFYASYSTIVRGN
jgi:hypothetical protein